MGADLWANIYTGEELTSTELVKHIRAGLTRRDRWESVARLKLRKQYPIEVRQEPPDVGLMGTDAAVEKLLLKPDLSWIPPMPGDEDD